MKKDLLKTIIPIVIILGTSLAIYLYSDGYRLKKDDDNTNVNFKKTGIISARSIPESANIYVNDVLSSTTNDSISGLNPGFYKLSISKSGFVPWEKQIEVFEDLATDVTAVLISQTPKLEPLTSTGASSPTVSPSLNNLAYFSKDPKESGVWVVPLVNAGINFFRNAPYTAFEDTSNIILSNGKSIEWSPKEDKLLVETANETFYILDLETQTIQSTQSPELLKKSWMDEVLDIRLKFLQRLGETENMVEIATKPETLWSPDEKKFLYTVENDDQIEYRVYNMEKPRPVGENIDNLVFSTLATETQPKISWYADSYHLILVEGNIEQDKKGTVSIIRIDGTNKTEVYGSTLYEDKVSSDPNGDKLIISTTFKSNELTDLYTIGIR